LRVTSPGLSLRVATAVKDDCVAHHFGRGIQQMPRIIPNLERGIQTGGIGRGRLRPGYTLSRVLQLEEREEAKEHVHPMSRRGLAATLIMIVGLFCSTALKSWPYAFLYRGREFPEFTRDQAVRW